MLAARYFHNSPTESPSFCELQRSMCLKEEKENPSSILPHEPEEEVCLGLIAHIE